MNRNVTASGLIVMVVAALSAACLGGCGAIDALGLSRPTASVVGVRLKDIGLKSSTLLFDVEIGNPYSVPLPLANVDYSLASRGKQFLSAQADVQGTVPAGGKKTISLPAKIDYMGLLGVLKNVRPGSVVPYQANMGVSVDAPAAGRLRLATKKEGKLPVPAAPGVKVTEIKWNKLSLDSAGGVVRLKLTNKNSFPVNLSKLSYALSLGGVDVAGSSLARPMSFAADGGTGTVEIPISLSPKNLGLGAFRMLTGKGSGYKLSGTLDAGTEFGPMSLPINRIGKTIFKR